MKCLYRFLTILFAFWVVTPCLANSYEERETVVLRVLNKAAGKVQAIRVGVGKTVNFEKISIVARSCKQTSPFDAENFFAFIEISDASQKQIYGGWMNRNEPGKNPLQNPDYDVWLVSCE